MKMIVFGSSGFIGSHLVQRLKELNHEVIEIHHNEHYKIDKADYIFYLQSYCNHYHQNDKYQTVKANIIDLYNLLKATKDLNYKGFIHFSTSSVTLPVQTLYSDSKFVAELICKRYARKYKKPIVSIRPFSVFGEGESSFRFIPTIIDHLGTGKVMKITEGYHDWIYCLDFIDTVITVINNMDKIVGKCISIGTGVQTSNLTIIRKMIDISCKSLQTKFDDSVSRTYDNSNWVADTTIIKSLGWKPKHTLEEGLRKTYESFGKKSN